MVSLDIQKVPLSYPGSYYTIRSLEASEEPEGLYICSLHHDAWQTRAIQILTGKEEQETNALIQTAPEGMRLYSGNGWAGICFADENSIIFSARKLSLTFRYVKASQVVERGAGIWEMNCHGQNMKVLLYMQKGDVKTDSYWDGDNCTYIRQNLSEDGEGVLYFIRDRGGCNIKPDAKEAAYDACVRKNRRKFAQWMNLPPAMPKRYLEAFELASYINWSSMVAPYGKLECPTMYASKVSMTGIWSWDHCFHGLGVFDISKEEAFRQWGLMFTKQAVDGSLPDRVDDAVCWWSFAKPPVHGYFLSWMREHGLQMTLEEQQYAYEHLEKWTEYWFLCHDTDRDGIPDYDNGNDSGWDNNTVMVMGSPVESPDLAVWLILQMDCLASLAWELSLEKEAKAWKEKSRKLEELLLEHFWDRERQRMVGRMSGSHEKIDSDSLILYIPLLLGKRLPEDIRNKMIRDLKEEGAFLTEFGLATERLDSPWYTPDGYWRGPIWAPSTYLICEGLERCGEKGFADMVREKFLSMCASKMSMPENFNAVTAEPLRDSALVWTASVFVRMATDLWPETKKADR